MKHSFSLRFNSIWRFLYIDDSFYTSYFYLWWVFRDFKEIVAGDWLNQLKLWLEKCDRFVFSQRLMWHILYGWFVYMIVLTSRKLFMLYLVCLKFCNCLPLTKITQTADLKCYQSKLSWVFNSFVFYFPIFQLSLFTFSVTFVPFLF